MDLHDINFALKVKVFQKKTGSSHDVQPILNNDGSNWYYK